MKRSIIAAAAFGVAATAAHLPAAAQSDMSAAHAHIGHVAKSWPQTPGEVGLLAIARADAETAHAHAGYGLADPDDLAAMQMHAGHVLMAVAPESGDVPVGSGFGVRRGAEGVATHIGLAASSDGASDNVKLHAVHVASAANNTVARTEEIVEVAGRIMAASSADEARPYAERLHELTAALIEGVDANGDGNIGWQEGEGGLATAELHMMLMMRGEGMSED